MRCDCINSLSLPFYLLCLLLVVIFTLFSWFVLLLLCLFVFMRICHCGHLPFNTSCLPCFLYSVLFIYFSLLLFVVVLSGETKQNQGARVGRQQTG